MKRGSLGKEEKENENDRSNRQSSEGNAEDVELHQNPARKKLRIMNCEDTCPEDSKDLHAVETESKVVPVEEEITAHTEQMNDVKFVGKKMRAVWTLPEEIALLKVFLEKRHLLNSPENFTKGSSKQFWGKTILEAFEEKYVEEQGCCLPLQTGPNVNKFTGQGLREKFKSLKKATKGLFRKPNLNESSVDKSEYSAEKCPKPEAKEFLQLFRAYFVDQVSSQSTPEKNFSQCSIQDNSSPGSSSAILTPFEHSIDDSACSSFSQSDVSKPHICEKVPKSQSQGRGTPPLSEAEFQRRYLAIEKEKVEEFRKIRHLLAKLVASLTHETS